MQQIFAIILLALRATGHAAEPFPRRQLNVLFIAADDLRNDLGCYGNTLVKTPSLDRLTKRGVVFNRAYCQQALCNPSRASLMTGRHPDTLHIWDLPMHFRDTTPDAVTLAQYVKQHGYFTQNIGKIYHHWRQEIHGDPASWSVPTMMHFATHSNDKPVTTDPLPPDFAKFPGCEQRDVLDEAYYDGRAARLAVDAVQEYAAVQRFAQPKPFCLCSARKRRALGAKAFAAWRSSRSLFGFTLRGLAGMSASACLPEQLAQFSRRHENEIPPHFLNNPGNVIEE